MTNCCCVVAGTVRACLHTLVIVMDDDEIGWGRTCSISQPNALYRIAVYVIVCYVA